MLAETEAVVEGLLASSYTLVTQREPSNQVVLCPHMLAGCMTRHHDVVAVVAVATVATVVTVATVASRPPVCM